MKPITLNTDLIVFSLERWGSTFTRTSQIMSRFARHRNVFFIEAPIIGVAKTPMYLLRETRDDVMVIEPYLPEEISIFEQKQALIEIVNKLISDEKIKNYSVWTDTPRSVPLFRHLAPQAIIYDCLNDYSVTHQELEKEMFERADIVLTSGPSLYAAKRSLHSNIHHNPDCVDYRHFFQGRLIEEESEDLSNIPHPRIGFAGVIDERIDMGLIENLATMRPDWHFVLAGEIVGLDKESLPKNANIHFISHKGYSKLPIFLSNLDCTFVPYKVCDETHFLNPSLIAESLISGKPVVATPLPDVVSHFVDPRLVSIAEFPIDFESKINSLLSLSNSRVTWLALVDEHYKGMSWNNSCERMEALEQDIYSIKSNLMIQTKIKEMFKKVFTSKTQVSGPWVQSINLKRVSRL